jgi:hypothetical protein
VTYDPNAYTLQAQYAFTRLAPSSTHPMHAHGEHRLSPGPVLYDRKTSTADAAGNSSGVVTASNVTTDQPSSSWYIDLHNGTGSGSFDQLALTCAAAGILVAARSGCLWGVVAHPAVAYDRRVRHDGVTWLDLLAPLMVIGLMGEIFYFITSSEAVRGYRRQRARFLPTRRDLEALPRLWRRQLSRLRRRAKPPPSS